MNKIIGVVGPIAVGYACLTFLTPSEKDILSELPENERHRYEELKKEREERAKQGNPTDLLALLLKQNVESNRPFWDVRPVNLDTEEGVSLKTTNEVVQVSDQLRTRDEERKPTQGNRFFR